MPRTMEELKIQQDIDRGVLEVQMAIRAYAMQLQMVWGVMLNERATERDILETLEELRKP